MNLNLAMVNLYKQRTGSNTLKPKRSPNKPGMDNKAKMSKLEETIAAIDMKSKTTFEQLCGVEEARNELCLIVNRFKDAFEGKAGKSKWPVLIRGSEGLGKTALVEATANYANLNLIPIQLGRFVGLTRNKFEESLEHLIRHGIANQPAIVLIDNLERLSDKEDFRNLIGEAVKRLLEEPLKLLVFCTSSSPLDILTGIRFQFTILLKRPTFEARLGILRNLREESKNLIELTDDDLRAIAMNTPSFSPLDLCLMLDMAVTLHLDRKPTLEICEKAIDKVKKSFEQGTRLIGERPTVTWEQIGGMEEVRQEFADILKQARRVGGSCKFAGIALYGPPGCGKTMVAQAMANEAGFNFISIKPAELVDKFLGETEKNIRQVFQEASEHEPCMIYFDEFDGLCGTRGNKETVTSAIQTLLSEMDGFIGRGQSIIMASTNRLEDIDPAMKRAGRLTEHIYIGPPDLSARREILNVITNKPGLSLAANVDLDMWAKETDSFSGAELDFLVAKAIAKARGDDDEQVVLKQEHFVYAMHRIRRANRELDKKTRSSKRSKID